MGMALQEQGQLLPCLRWLCGDSLQPCNVPSTRGAPKQIKTGLQSIRPFVPFRDKDRLPIPIANLSISSTKAIAHGLLD